MKAKQFFSFFNYKSVPRNIFVFGLVSFLTDFSSDMIYPLLPVFLVTYLHAGQSFVGLVEGIAESTAAFFTLCSGIWADRAKDRSKLVLAGYALSSLARPLVALAWSPWVVLFVRFSDRVGKGIRTSPRDSLIADSVHPSHRGRAYGFHRSMDHLGAVAGPLTAAFLLSAWGTDLRVLFALAAIPGFFAVALIIWKVREVLPARRPASADKIKIKFPEGRLRIYLLILFIFVLSCSSDAFLILRAQELGVHAAMLPIVWLCFNLIKSLLTFPFGALSDKVGRRKMIFAGWTIYSLVYFSFAHADQTWHAWALFACYALFYAITEGSERAILADYANAEEKGQAFGWYYFLVGIGALPASLFFGWMWQTFGSRAAFLTSASISCTAALFLLIFLLLCPSPQKRVPPIPSPLEKD